MRYLGGKARLAKIISKELHKYINKDTVYYEPFCGSCNVATLVSARTKILSDKSPVVFMYEALVNKGWTPPQTLSEQEYKLLKISGNYENPLYSFAAFGCSFGGKFWGGFARNNVGHNYALSAHNTLLKKKALLKESKCVFEFKDYRDVKFVPNSVVYCDPRITALHRILPLKKSSTQKNFLVLWILSH